MASEMTSRVQAIFECYYYEKAKRRYYYLSNFAKRYLEQFKFDEMPEGSIECFISDSRIRAVVDSYFIDVIRYKEAHFVPESSDPFSLDWVEKVHTEKFISPSKVAAFSVKWILQYSPIYLEFAEQSEKSDNLVKIVNPYLALNVSMDVFDMLATDLDGNFISEILHHMKYRSFDEKAFFLLYSQWDSKIAKLEFSGE